MNTFICMRGPLKIKVNGPKKSILAENVYMLTNFWQERITCSVLMSLYDPRQLTENLKFN